MDQSRSDEEQLRQLKTVLWPKAYREGDVVLLDTLLHDDFEMIEADGNRSTKDDELSYVRDAKWDPGAFEYQIERLQVFEGRFAIVSGLGITTTYSYRSSNVLMKVEGSWRAVASHVSGVTIRYDEEE